MATRYIPDTDTSLDRKCPSCGGQLEVDCEPYGKSLIVCSECDYTESFGIYASL